MKAFDRFMDHGLIVLGVLLAWVVTWLIVRALVRKHKGGDATDRRGWWW